MGMGEEHAVGGAVATDAPEGGAVTEKTPSTGRDMEAVLLNVKTP